MFKLTSTHLALPVQLLTLGSKVRDLDESTTDKQLLASEILDGESGNDRRRDTQSVDADGDWSSGTGRQSTGIADDLLEVGVDGGVSAESLQRYDGRHHCQPTAQLAQHRQPLVQRQVLQRQPTSH